MIIDFLVSAFAQLEKNKIAHCDIKPENILVLNKK
jgi:serine/threonine protein kinase